MPQDRARCDDARLGNVWNCTNCDLPRWVVCRSRPLQDLPRRQVHRRWRVLPNHSERRLRSGRSELGSANHSERLLRKRHFRRKYDVVPGRKLRGRNTMRARAKREVRREIGRWTRSRKCCPHWWRGRRGHSTTCSRRVSRTLEVWRSLRTRNVGEDCGATSDQAHRRARARAIGSLTIYMPIVRLCLPPHPTEPQMAIGAGLS